MPELDEPTEDIVEHYRNRGNVHELIVTTTLSGSRAVEARGQLTWMTPEKRGEQRLAEYRVIDPTIESAQWPTVSDDTSTNTITIRERYRLPEFWIDGRRTVAPLGIAEIASPPEKTARTAPLAVRHPIYLRYRILVDLPEGFPGTQNHKLFHNEFFRMTFNEAYQENTLELAWTFQSKTSAVQPHEMARYSEALADASQVTAYQLSWGIGERGGTHWVKLLIAIGAFVVLGGAVQTIARRRARA
jgi:hypothetical protein